MMFRVYFRYPDGRLYVQRDGQLRGDPAGAALYPTEEHARRAGLQRWPGAVDRRFWPPLPCDARGHYPVVVERTTQPARLGEMVVNRPGTYAVQVWDEDDARRPSDGFLLPDGR
jgi:hypothetical protein